MVKKTSKSKFGKPIVLKKLRKELKYNDDETHILAPDKSWRKHVYGGCTR